MSTYSNDEEMKRLAEEREAQSPLFTKSPEEEKKEEETVTSLGVASRFQKLEERHLASELGWMNVPLDNLPTRGLFYQDGTQITIRAANQAEIRHFSAIEEEDLSDTEEKLSFVLDKCCKIRVPGSSVTFKDIKEIDRLPLLFLIRDLTFKQSPTKLLMDVNCSHCGNKEQIEIGRKHFDYLKIDEKLMEYYDSNEKCFRIRTTTGEEFDVYMPSLGVVAYIKNMIINKSRRSEHFDTPFAFKYAAFSIQDWRTLSSETNYNKYVMESLQWSVPKVTVFSGIVDMLKSSVDPTIHHNCGVCSGEVTAPLAFRGGLKRLFIPDISDFLA